MSQERKELEAIRGGWYYSRQAHEAVSEMSDEEVRHRLTTWRQMERKLWLLGAVIALFLFGALWALKESL